MTAPAAIIIRNELPQEIVAISAEAMAQVRALAAQAATINPTDAAGLEDANKLYRHIDTIAKEIAADRLARTRPIDSLKGLFIAAEREAVEPLAEAKKGLAQRILACQRELERQRKEAERIAREESERLAAAERARMQAEAAAREEERRAAQAAAEEEARLFGTEPEQVTAPAPSPVVPAATVVRAAVPVAPPVPKAAVRTVTRWSLEITDRAALIAEACRGGGAIHGRPVVVIDEKAVRALLDAGTTVPGARLVAVEGIASAGGR